MLSKIPREIADRIQKVTAFANKEHLKAKVLFIPALFILLFFLALSPAGVYAQSQNSVEGDWQALMDLYESTNGNNWDDNTGWGGDPSTMGSWVGIETNSEGRVVRVDMLRISDMGTSPSGKMIYTGNNLTGTLPESIGNLTKCEYFNVKQNNFTGSIPSSIGNMVSLEYLLLGGQRWDPNVDSNSDWNSYNHTKGTDPDGLGKKYQETNAFSGSIPSTIGNLISLITLEARRQHLTGSLPSEIGNLSNLKGIFLNHQKTSPYLNGSLPSTVEGWKSLKHLHLNYNGFSGDIPSGIGTLSEIRHFRLDHNNFTSIPDLSGITDLRYFDIGSNELEGSFPSGIFDNDHHPFLNAFDISWNKFTGKLPTSYVGPNHPQYKDGTFETDNYHSMSIFSLTGNNFTADIPEWIQKMAGHKQVLMNYNNLDGTFPLELTNQIQVRLFHFEYNQLHGDLPEANWASEKLLYLKFFSNSFTGSIPDSWESLKNSNRLSTWEMHDNFLSGEIPKWIGELEHLDNFSIHKNKFTFKDILPHFDFIRNNVSNYEYYPQKPFGNEINRTKPEGALLVLDLSEFDYPGNEYQWVKDGVAIEGATSPILEIQSVSASDEGEYRLEVTNSDLPALGTHSSMPISFSIGEDDGMNGGDDSSDGGSGDTSPEIPSLNTPQDEATGLSTSPNLDWNSASGADTYHLQVSSVSDFSTTVTDITGLTATEYETGGLAYNKIYYWRVQATNENGSSDWSAAWEFKTVSDSSGDDDGGQDAPALVSPADSEENVSTALSFSWTSIDADEYILHVTRTDENGNQEEFFYSDNEGQSITDTTITLSKTTLPDRVHYWRVRGVSNGVKGEWSSIRNFTTGSGDATGPPAAPTLNSPSNDVQNISLTPTFSWNSVDADHYILQVTATESSAVEIETVVNGTEFTPDEELDQETEYSWRVRAVKDGVEGEWSTEWTFITGTAGEMETSLDQNYPNPFNPSTQIRFNLAETQKVSLKVYDTVGRLVATIVEGTLTAGSYERTFQADNLASGVYFLRFITENRVLTSQMTLMK